MLKRYLSSSMKMFCFVMLVFVGQSCSREYKDKEIKADITSKAKTDVDFAGLTYTVKDGIVTLNGNFASEKAKNEVMQKIKDIAGVEDVADQTVIAPVIISSDFPLKQSVDSALKHFPQIAANVTDSTIYLKGAVEKDALTKVIKAVNSLHSKGTVSQLMIK